MEITKGIVISLFGKPNVGKSTIFNSLQNNTYAIVTHKPQTTRDYISTKIETDKGLIVLLDTPGFHKPNNKLDMFLNSQVKYALKLANLTVYIADPTRPTDEEDKEILTYMDNLNDKQKLLIINKIDIASAEQIETKINDINKIVKFDNVLKISAINKYGINEIKEFVDNNCTYEEIEPQFFTEPNDEFVVKEIIRETCLQNLQKEVPYGISVIVNKFKYDNVKNQLDIDADLYVEKESQKGIVVGKGATMIKKIGTESRMKLLDIYDCKIDLRLYVKVKSDWRNNNDLVKLMGYKK